MARFKVGDEVMVLKGHFSGRSGIVKSVGEHGYSVLLKEHKSSTIFWHGELRKRGADA